MSWIAVTSGEAELADAPYWAPALSAGRQADSSMPTPNEAHTQGITTDAAGPRRVAGCEVGVMRIPGLKDSSLERQAQRHQCED
ncbi:MAG: hypothetical protein ABS955_03300 [Stenotrophomonas maltophilia]